MYVLVSWIIVIFPQNQAAKDMRKLEEKEKRSAK